MKNETTSRSGRSGRTRRGRPDALVENYYEEARGGGHRWRVCHPSSENTSAACRDPRRTYDRDVLTVREIWRYPVKSLGGERLDHADIGHLGITGDRGWGVRDRLTGMILTGRREPRLLMLSAHLVDGAPAVFTDDGTPLDGSDALAAWLDRPVELVAAGDTPGTFENPLDVEREDDWISWQGQPGSFHDGRSTVSLVSTASLADHDRRRFRMNLVLDGHGEDDLVEHDVTVGSTRLHVRKAIDRCVMVGRAQPGLPADRSVLQRVIRERGNLMGVGAVVVAPGTVTVGDAVTPA